MEILLQNFRYALRLLRKSPGFALAAVLTLALGMGANTVMFSVLNVVLLRPLPYPQPDRLVQIWETDSHIENDRGPVSPYNFVDWRSHSQTLEQMATYDFQSGVLTSGKTSVRLGMLAVTASFFDVMKVAPLKGRTFLPDEDDPAKPRVAVLSYSAWQNRFGGDAAIVGRSIVLDDQVYTVIGVMPAGFEFPTPGTALWCTPGFDLKQHTRAHHALFAVGRLKPGIKFEQAQSEMNTIAQQLQAQYHQTSGVRLVRLQDEIVGRAKRSIWVLWGAVVVVLMIACANVAGLLLARAVGRYKEVAIRSALGSSRSRLVQQFLVESVLLAVLGGALGLVLAYSVGNLVVLASDGAVPRLQNLKIDGWVLAFSVAACLVTGIAFGLAPALKALRVDLNYSLKESGAAQEISRLGLRNIFVIAEVALAMVLLVSGGLLIKTLWQLQHVDAGFNPENILTFRFSLPPAKFKNSPERRHIYEQVEERLAALPGVEAVGSTNDLPFGGSRSGSSFEIDGRVQDLANPLHADYRTVSAGYFSAMRMRLLAGRGFTVHDTQEAKFVAVINQTFAKKFLAGEDPIGRRVKSNGKLYEIVGVIADVKHQELSAQAFPELYVCDLQADLQPWRFYAVRSGMDVKALINSVRNAVLAVAPTEPIYSLNTMADRVEYSTSPQKFSSLLLAIFAGLALMLACIGIYGMIAYTVARRTREIGIRLALGAERADVLRLILRHGILIAALGLALGSVATYVATQTLSSMLYGVSVHDPIIFFAVAASVFMVVMLASYIPARKATQVDPLIALRYE